MNAKMLGLLTRDAYLMNFLAGQLKDVFGDYIAIEPQYYFNNHGAKPFKAGVVLVSGQTTEAAARKLNLIGSGTQTINLRRIIINPDNVEAVQALLRIKKGTRVVIGTNDAYMAEELASSFRDTGVEHLEFAAYYPNSPPLPADAEIAVVFGHPHLAPHGMKQVIDMGMRYISMQTILEIVQALDIKGSDINLSFLKYIKAIIGIVHDLVKSNEAVEHRGRMLQRVIAISENGLLLLSDDKKILYCNEKAREFFGERKELLGRSILEYVPQMDEIIKNKSVNNDDIITINGQNHIISINTVEISAQASGYVVMLHKTENIERLESQVRQKLYGKVFKAKYTFDDIITDSAAFRTLKDFARKAAQSNCNIVIYGESGTGKELYAQAIHNASSQRKEPFVPANVAAMQDNLIESELFGYEEGAFTGAKRGGKPGIFELAHNGTVFLDEIGELSWQMQSKMLRVLQEREVMRLGGTRIIPVNVRIIAATNRNLREMVNAGKFRSDLYFRLHVLPISLPPLRERPADIELLMRHFLAKSGIAIDCIPDNLRDYLKNYRWPGNIRELENFCSYIPLIHAFCDNDQATMVKKIFEFIGKPEEPGAEAGGPPATLRGKMENHRYRRDFEAILGELKSAYDNNKPMSRKKLLRRLNPATGLTEHQIRARLEQLSAWGMIAAGSTKQGSAITPAGLNYLLAKKAY